ncbi:MAG: hypothetical protein FWG63_02890 [Defluviitaleaceae bacterium]|nr:hypothetical protein [Defluviitaleaceae bacterium]
MKDCKMAKGGLFKLLAVTLGFSMFVASPLNVQASETISPTEIEQAEIAEINNDIATMQQIWGPSRETFALQNPAPYATFNSMENRTDGTLFGSTFGSGNDERDFVKLATDRGNPSTIVENMTVANGQEVYVLAFVHNNASPNSNLVAEDVYINFNISGRSRADADGRQLLSIFGFINSSNANPPSIWDNATLIAEQPFILSYVEGTAQWAGRGIGDIPQVYELSNPTLESGAKLHDINPCNQYEGWVTFRVRVEYIQHEFSITNHVRQNGEDASAWADEVNAEIGDILNFRLVYTQIGNVTNPDVILLTDIPAGLEFIPGSTRISNASNPKHSSVAPELDTAENNITNNGLNIGRYRNNANAVITFSARVVDSAYFSESNENILVSTATAIVDQEDRSASAQVLVD